jgi:hypothetical protein
MTTRQHVFASQPTEDTVYHDEDEGSVSIVGGATLAYYFDNSDGSVRLRIEGEWLWKDSIDDLISILEGMKQRIVTR